MALPSSVTHLDLRRLQASHGRPRLVVGASWWPGRLFLDVAVMLSWFIAHGGAVAIVAPGVASKLARTASSRSTPGPFAVNSNMRVVVLLPHSAYQPARV